MWRAAVGKLLIEKARRALPFTPGFLKMAVENLANDQIELSKSTGGKQRRSRSEGTEVPSYPDLRSFSNDIRVGKKQ